MLSIINSAKAQHLTSQIGHTKKQQNLPFNIAWTCAYHAFESGLQASEHLWVLHEVKLPSKSIGNFFLVVSIRVVDHWKIWKPYSTQGENCGKSFIREFRVRICEAFAVFEKFVTNLQLRQLRQQLLHCHPRRRCRYICWTKNFREFNIFIVDCLMLVRDRL